VKEAAQQGAQKIGDKAYISDCETKLHWLLIEIENKVKDHRAQTTSYLARHFQFLGIPSFETQEMVKKKDARGNKRVSYKNI